MPGSFVETPDGLVLYADGFGLMLRWDGFTPQAEPAGVPAPTTALTMSSSGNGGIVGTYTAYTRFLDSRGNPSNLSPVSASITPVGATGVITGATNALPIVITSPFHGLLTGAVVKITGVQGTTAANTTATITVIDPNHFALNAIPGDAAYTTGGVWVSGVLLVTYANVPTPLTPAVVRRQILRNTDGQATTYYVDVDTLDLSSSTFTSGNVDQTLLTKTAVPILDINSKPVANVYGIPPDDRTSLAFHQGRVFGTGVIEYSEGAVAITFGSKTVTGIGTEWTSGAKGRFLFVVGGDKAYEVASVDTASQTLMLVNAFTGSTSPYAIYALQVAPATRRLVFYTEAGKPEAWPSFNAISVPEDGDEITGLLTKGSFIYILERRHVYRYTFQDDPALDGGIFLSSRRGCINNRCVVLVEDSAYMLDEEGVHAFEGGKPSSTITTPIQTLFRAAGFKDKIQWAASRYFHASHDPSRETIRFFVSLEGQYLPRHAICYAYQLERWWIEEYAEPIGSSVLGKLGRSATLNTWGVGRDQVFLGGPFHRVLARGASPLDGVGPDATMPRGIVLGSTPLTLTLDVEASANLIGNTLTISAGRGIGQRRSVTAVSGNVASLDRPWLVTPDGTSVWSAGGVSWQWLSGWFRFLEEEQANARRFEISYEPTDGPAQMSLRRYRDRSDVPINMGVSRSLDGVATEAGMPDNVISMLRSKRPGGFVQGRFDGSRESYTDGQRLIALSLQGVAGPEPIQIYQINLDGATDGKGQ